MTKKTKHKITTDVRTVNGQFIVVYSCMACGREFETSTKSWTEPERLQFIANLLDDCPFDIVNEVMNQ